MEAGGEMNSKGNFCMTNLSGFGDAARMRGLFIFFSLPCGREGFFGSVKLTEETDNCLLRPSPPGCHCSWGVSGLASACLDDSAGAKDTVDRVCSDEATLSFVLPLVVDPPPAASPGKYPFPDVVDTTVRGETSDPGLEAFCPGVVDELIAEALIGS